MRQRADAGAARGVPTALAATPIPAINYDASETVSWPQFAAIVAAVRGQPPDTHVAVLARNHGEADAVDHC
jgi:hypothetical protein